MKYCFDHQRSLEMDRYAEIDAQHNADEETIAVMTILNTAHSRSWKELAQINKIRWICKEKWKWQRDQNVHIHCRIDQQLPNPCCGQLPEAIDAENWLHLLSTKH